MNLIVVGCGRVGAELCYHLFKNGHQVVVVDINKESFNRLHPDLELSFHGGRQYLSNTAVALKRCQIARS